MEVWIGCCGFCESQQKYFQDFKTIEIQKTFYQLINKNLAKKWRERAPENFIFNLKVFQGITHPSSSPTWKRANIDVEKIKEKVGFLKPSVEVLEFWEKQLEIAKILKARVLVLQLPKSFRDEKENWRNAKKFFSKINRNNFLIGVELRSWKEESRKKFCKKFEVIDVVDPFATKPQYLTKENVAYFRLHGSPPGKRMYSYKYTKKDLGKLKEFVEETGAKEVFVMFNNIFMKENALAFSKML